MLARAIYMDAKFNLFNINLSIESANNFKTLNIFHYV